MFNGTKDDRSTKEVPNIGGFQSGSQYAANLEGLSDINITKLNEEIENLKSSGQSEEFNLPETDSTTTTTVPSTTQTIPSTSINTPTTTSTTTTSTSAPLSKTSESYTKASSNTSTFRSSF